MSRVRGVTMFRRYAEIMYETTAAMAVPIGPYRGIRTMLRRTFAIAPTVDLKRESFVRFSVKSHGPCATPKKTKKAAQM
jgi:hypothetical protein